MNPMSRFTLFLTTVAFCLTLALGACTTTDARDRLVVQTAFKYTLMRYIDRADDPVERAHRIVDGADRVLAVLDDELVTLSVVKAVVREQFDYENRPLYDQMLIDDLILAVEDSLQEAVEGAELSEDTELKLVRVIGLAQSVAKAYLGQ